MRKEALITREDLTTERSKLALGNTPSDTPFGE
jgi:hypothetical protein